jgi:hypothetical protein
MIPVRAVNCFVNSIWMSMLWPLDPIVHSKVHSTHDAAVAITENDAASTLLPQFCRVSSTSLDSHAPLSCVLKDAQRVAEGARIRDEANRQQFHVALLEDCSFFARLVLRHVRAGGNPSAYLLDRYSPGKKRNVVEVSQTILRSSSSILSGPLMMEERSLQPEAEAASPSLKTLWVEVGCRHAQTLVSEKERHEYRKDSKPAL